MWWYSAWLAAVAIAEVLMAEMAEVVLAKVVTTEVVVAVERRRSSLAEPAPLADSPPLVEAISAPRSVTGGQAAPMQRAVKQRLKMGSEMRRSKLV